MCFFLLTEFSWTTQGKFVSLTDWAWEQSGAVIAVSKMMQKEEKMQVKYH